MDYRQPGIAHYVAEARALPPTRAQLDERLRDLTRFREILARGAEAIVEELRSLDEAQLGRRRLASEERRYKRLLLDLRDLDAVLPSKETE